LARVPHVRVTKPRMLPKRPFTIDEARQIFLQTRKTTGTSKMAPRYCALWWQALVSVLYFTGVRIGTALKLEWRMVESAECGMAEDSWRNRG
jgi:integrase